MDFAYLQSWVSGGGSDASSTRSVIMFDPDRDSVADAESVRGKTNQNVATTSTSKNVRSTKGRSGDSIIMDDPTFGQDNFDIDLGDDNDDGIHDRSNSNVGLSITKSLSSFADRVLSAAEKYSAATRSKSNCNEEDHRDLQKNNSDTSDTSDSSKSNEDEDVENPKLRRKKSSGPIFYDVFDEDDISIGEPPLEDPKAAKYRRREDAMTTELLQESHCQCFAHGHIWTMVGIIFSWLGFALAFLARRSNSFVTLENPMYVDPVFDPIDQVGMVNLQLCFNETYVEDPALTGCTIHRLDSTDINDAMFQVSRILVSLVILLGGFMSAFLTSTMFWSSINLRPIGIGYLISYFLQSFTFLFFDTNLCAQYKCHISTGCYYSIIASICWILACVASSRMDVHKLDQKERKEQILRRLRRRKIRAQRYGEASFDERDYTNKLGSRSNSDNPQKRSSSGRDSVRRSSRSPSKRSKSPQKNGRSNSLTRSYQNGLENRQGRKLEVIDGIDDIEAHQAWNAHQKAARDRSLERNHSLERQKEITQHKQVHTKLSLAVKNPYESTASSRSATQCEFEGNSRRGRSPSRRSHSRVSSALGDPHRANPIKQRPKSNSDHGSSTKNRMQPDQGQSQRSQSPRKRSRSRPRDPKSPEDLATTHHVGGPRSRSRSTGRHTSNDSSELFHI